MSATDNLGQLGGEGKTYLGDTLFTDDGSGGVTPPTTWEEVDAVIDATGEASRPASEIVNRGTTTALNLFGKLRSQITLVLTYRTAQADRYKQLRDAFLNNQPVAIADMTDALTTTGSEGWQGNFGVESMNKPKVLEDGVKVTFVLKPSACSEVGPQYVEVA